MRFCFFFSNSDSSGNLNMVGQRVITDTAAAKAARLTSLFTTAPLEVDLSSPLFSLMLLLGRRGRPD
jgi:hypothetical protein